MLVLATLRTSQIEAVAAARDSARTHQAGRTPNIPGDTPWTRAGDSLVFCLPLGSNCVVLPACALLLYSCQSQASLHARQATAFRV